MLNLVTGYRGEPHITADDEGAKNLALFGEFLVFSTGEKLGHTLVSNNQIRIKSGDLMVQGRYVRLTGYEDVTIETGSASTNRKDLICLRYEKNGSTGVETVKLVNIKGAETSGTPAAPAYNTGSILDGDSTVDFPIYEVTLKGLSVSAVTALFVLHDSIFGAGTRNGITTGTLQASKWSGKKYSFESEYPSDECDIWIQVDASATEAQAKAFGAALIAGSASSNVFTALGEVPTVNIPIIIRKVAK